MQQYGLLCLLILFICGYYAQDPTTTPGVDWNGDPTLCTADPSVTSAPGPPLPTFSNQAEFALERVEIKHILNTTLPSELTMYQYLYDYNANKLIMVKNSNGFIDVEYYYYELLKKSTYYRGEFCVVSDIRTNFDMDGASATQLTNGTWHIRPLNEFLLFSSFDPRRPIIRPKYIGQAIVRGIPVDQWESCIINKTELRTVRRIWSFAQRGVSMPIGVVGDLAVPVQALISASILMPNGTQAFEFDEVFNVLSYRPGIVESSDQLSPPKGVFCKSGNDQNLVSLQDVGIDWPDRFNVRVDASTSRSNRWRTFHLRYDEGQERGSRRLRYDYLPPGAEDYESVIHDYTENLTYVIDRRLGSCKIRRGVELLDVSPTVDPIGFFIRNEARFIFRQRAKVWEFNGYRGCRDGSVKCVIVTTSIDKFPNIIDSDTGKPDGETWEATNMEYGWSMRAPFASPESGSRKTFDYPVHLYLKLFRYGNPSNPSPMNVRTEDLEYEFYEMSHEIHPYDFDISTCYRSLNYDYYHIGFKLQLSRGNIIDGNHLNRRFLEREIHMTLALAMQIKYSRITDLEIDHESISNDVSVFFTLLGPTPKPESPTGLSENETAAEQARHTLREAIDGGKFKFSIRLTDEDNTEVQFTAIAKSLRGSKHFMSTHVSGRQVVNESYSSGSQAGAIIGGLIVGLLVGVLVAAIVRIVRKDPMPSVPQLGTSITNPLPNISFYNKKSANGTTTTTTPTTPTSDA